MVLEPVIIKEVQRNPCIYNKNDKFYNDHRVREVAWKQIASATKTSVSECKRTWGILRDSLRRVLKKRLNGQDESYRKVWKYEEEMSFLIPYIHTKPSAKVTSSEDEEDDGHSLVNENRLDDTSNHRSGCGQVIEMMPALRPAGEDDVDAFFKCIATTVKKFPLRQRILIKKKVFELVTGFEMEYCRRLDGEGEGQNPFADEDQPSPLSTSTMWSEVKVEEM